MRLIAKISCCALLVLTEFPLAGFSQNSDVSTGGSQSLQLFRPFSATVWTSITYPMPNGATRIVTQRTAINRDSQGRSQKMVYGFTNGSQYDTSAPLDRTESAVTAGAPESPAPSLSSGESLETDENLGTRIESGLTTQGRRRTFRSLNPQTATKHILETWYSPVLGMIVHSESHNFSGTLIVSDLTNLKLGSAPVASGSVSPTARQAPSELRLYQALFSIVAHMERARLGDSPSQVGDVAAVEDSLRAKMKLSQEEWQSFVATSVKVDGYTQQIDKQARAFAHQGRATSQQSLNPADALANVRADLHKMQVDQDNRILRDIKDLEAKVSANSTTRIHEYLQGPLTAASYATPVRVHGKGAR